MTELTGSDPAEEQQESSGVDLTSDQASDPYEDGAPSVGAHAADEAPRPQPRPAAGQYGEVTLTIGTTGVDRFVAFVDDEEFVIERAGSTVSADVAGTLRDKAAEVGVQINVKG